MAVKKKRFASISHAGLRTVRAQLVVTLNLRWIGSAVFCARGLRQRSAGGPRRRECAVP
jgi:hypothetical protein